MLLSLIFRCLFFKCVFMNYFTLSLLEITWNAWAFPVFLFHNLKAVFCQALLSHDVKFNVLNHLRNMK